MMLQNIITAPKLFDGRNNFSRLKKKKNSLSLSRNATTKSNQVRN